MNFFRGRTGDTTAAIPPTNMAPAGIQASVVARIIRSSMSLAGSAIVGVPLVMRSLFQRLLRENGARCDFSPRKVPRADPSARFDLSHRKVSKDGGSNFLRPLSVRPLPIPLLAAGNIFRL